MSSETPWIEPVADSVEPKRTNQQLRREHTRRVEDHIENTLSEDDRNAIKKVQWTVASYNTVVPCLGLVAGLLGAHRLRANKLAMLRAFRAQERPTHVVFASGRTGMLAQHTRFLGRDC